MNDLMIRQNPQPSIRYWIPFEAGWERMKQLLFRPFDLGFWLVLGFSAWIAGLASGPGGGSGNLGAHPEHVQESLKHGAHALYHSVLLLSLFSIIGIAVFVIVVLLFWVSSRGKFVYLDNVLNHRAAIIEPWGRLRELGDSLFLWRMGFLVAIILGVMLMAGTWIGFAAISGGSSPANWSMMRISFVGILGFIFPIIILAVGVSVTSLFLDSFIVPIMYRFDLRATEAWRYLLPWLKARPGAFIGYVLFMVLLLMGLGILSVLVCFLTCCLAALPYVGTVIFLPLLVTYRYFSMEWLAQLDPGFDFFGVPETENGEPEPIS